MIVLPVVSVGSMTRSVTEARSVPTGSRTPFTCMLSASCWLLAVAAVERMSTPFAPPSVVR